MWRECQKEYVDVTEMCKRIVGQYYPEGVNMEFTLNDVSEAFSRRG